MNFIVDVVVGIREVKMKLVYMTRDDYQKVEVENILDIVLITEKGKFNFSLRNGDLAVRVEDATVGVRPVVANVVTLHKENS